MVVAEKRTVKNVPEGYSAVTPWIVSPDSARLITFLTNAFGAEEVEGSRMLTPEGKIAHVEIRVDDAVIMLFDALHSWPATPSFIRLFVDNADASYEKALKAGGRSVTKPTMLSFGDKVGRVADPFGNIWWLQEHDADVSPKEISGEKAMKYVVDSLNTEMKKRSLPPTL